MAGFFSFVLTGVPAQAAVKKPVSVFPAPGTPVASEETTISFRGLKPKALGPVTVIATESGRHGGSRLAHSDGRGVSFVPKRAFVPGELVKVRTRKRIALTRNGDFNFRIGKFYGNDDKKGKPGTPNTNPKLESRPDLKPTVINVLKSTPGATSGKNFYAAKGDGLSISDNAGRVSWFRPTAFGGKGDQVLNFQAQKYEDKPVLTYWKGSYSAQSFSQIGRFEILNRKYNKIASFKPGNGYEADIHEFHITPRNTAMVLAYRGVKVDLSKYGGDKNGKVLDNVIQEIDIKSGAVLFEWHSIGNVGFGAVEIPPVSGVAWDYFHLNSIASDGGSILTSARFNSTIYRINRKNARVQWKLRGDGVKPRTNSFKMGNGTTFAFQHDAVRLPNGDISLFDNGVQPGVRVVNPCSAGLVLRLSNKGKQRRADLVSRVEHPDCLVANSQGSSQLLDNGNTFVGWGSLKQMTEFNPTGEVVFDATTPASTISSYRAYKFNWKGFPKDRPAIASEADGEGATVWASWNGATVGEWKVLTGSNDDDLNEVGSSVWKNLETSISIPTVGAKVRVVAYDPEGKQIGQSGLIDVGKQSR